jgi:DNA repair exonuclease SbcCD ATPase subunit
MPDLVLKKIKVRNWMTIHEADITFPECGLVWVTGLVGSGKTSLGEAVCRTLNGVQGRFSRLGDCSTRKQGNMLVQLEATLCDKELIVESGYRCQELSKSGEGLRFTYDGKQIERGHINDTRTELSQIIGITPQLARWAVFIDGDQLKFNQLSGKEAIELVMTALRQPPWTQWHDNAKITAAQFDISAAEATATHDMAIKTRDEASRLLQEAKDGLKEARLDYAEAKSSQEQRLKTLNSDIKKLEDEMVCCKEKIKNNRKTINAIEAEMAETYHQLDVTRQGLYSKLTVQQQAANKLSENKASASTILEDHEKALSIMLSEPDVCPKCGKPWDKTHSQEKINAQKITVNDSKTKLEHAMQAYRAQADVIANQHDKIVDIDNKIRETRVNSRVKQLSNAIKDLEEVIEDNGSKTDRLMRLSESITITTKHVDRYVMLVEERQRALDQANDSISVASKNIVETKEAVKVVKYWTKAFGPTGIPNMVLKDSIGPLNTIARQASMRLTNGAIVITFSTSRELKSGSERAELNINMENEHGAPSISGSSKGEAGLTNLIVAETLSGVGSVSNRVGFRWYDEILNSQDPTIRPAILAYLRETAQRLRILIFVVDHHQETANYADHILAVEKTAKGTVITWC